MHTPQSPPHASWCSGATVGRWLLVCAAFVIAMTVVGGLTRLTRSGLSIVEWQPITGVLPPWGDEAWSAAFAAYQGSPEGRLVNHSIDLAGFQEIYLIEWAHRLLGRVTGLVVLLPLLLFVATRRLRGRRAARVLGIFALGAVQGFLGWFMVKSGLVDAPHVSHYRLAMHLMMALLILGLLVWAALEELRPLREHAARALAPVAWTILGLLALTVVWGAFMAGLHAGHVAPTFPDMNGALVPSFRSILDDAIGVHFAHRMLGWCTALAAVAMFGLSRALPCPPRVRWVSSLLLLGVAGQIVLGALTVLHHVPLVLAALHQANGALLVPCAVALVHSLRRA